MGQRGSWGPRVPAQQKTESQRGERKIRLLREPTKTNEAGEDKTQGSTISAPEAMAQPKASHITGAQQGAKVRKDMEGCDVFN